MKKISFLLSLLLVSVLNLPAQKNSFEIRNGQFVLNGKATRILSGELHYPRIPHQYWKDRLLKLKATGFNTVSTYAFWNVHEPQPGVWDFTGDYNIAAFIRTAQEVGLQVILRPGPYVCAEWDFGGLPAWLLKKQDLRIRCSDPYFMQQTEKYLVRLGQEVKALQIQHGGPIIMVQLENEYGAYGNDKTYLNALKGILRKAGFTVPLFSADNPEDKMFQNTLLPEVGHVVNFGAISNTTPDRAFAMVTNYHPGFAQMCGEYWTGWFTGWGHKTWANPDFAIQKRDLEWMLQNNKSFNCYMVHGGSNFGFYAGANNWWGKYEPYITSYDYAAPISEAGIPTERAYAIRQLIQKYTSQTLPDYPSPQPTIEIPSFQMDASAALWENLPQPVRSAQPQSMEMYGQHYGYILYRTKLAGTRSGLMKVKGLQDYATVFLNGTYIGTLDRMNNRDTLRLPEVKEGEPVLEILVHALGRNNYGDRMVEERKGISGYVSFEPFTQMNWEIFPLPMENAYLKQLKFSNPKMSTQAGTFFKGSFDLKETGDTYLDLSQYQFGFVVINGHNLGRFWNKGPQYRLYCPAPWLKKGKNEIIIFDMHATAPAPVQGLKQAG